MAEVFQLSKYATDFATRSAGERIRAKLVEVHSHMVAGEVLRIDFSNVEVMTPSFADECLGKLAERIGEQVFRSTVLLSGANETVKALVNSVLSQRLRGPQAPASH